MAKILAVDDMDTERLNLVDILRKAGHEVVEARDGDEAIIVAEAELPDVIFMDIVMPKADGFRATKALLKNDKTKNIPVVIVSSKNQESDRFRATQLGAKGYIVKPAKYELIVEVLQDIL